MTVTEALKALQRAPKELHPFQARLACGFTPLHLQLFLNAHLQGRLPFRTVTVETGLYGSLANTLYEAAAREDHAVACVLEWPDLDPRFGYREAGEWSGVAVRDLISRSRLMLEQLGEAIQRISSAVPVAVSVPTLPLPPLFQTPGWQASEAEIAIDESLAVFAARLLDRKNTVLVNARRLLIDSPMAARLDLKSELSSGLPYTQVHADRLAASFSRLIAPEAPKKGVITDLDDTLWSGLVGEIGPHAVSWSVSSHSAIHGVYQRLLASLADAGVLVGIASKNDPGVAETALKRGDLLIRAEQIYPVEVHWEAKSGSVDRILRKWNVAADGVVFVDDSPMELAEVAAGHPGITCLKFPRNDPRAALAMMQSLRDLCGKESVTADDAIRLESIRRSEGFQREAESAPSPERFLEDAAAKLTCDFDAGWDDARALELVNKTNQFNLNGIRYNQADWRAKLARPQSFVLVMSYEDRFGPLGKISVVAGQHFHGELLIDTWVLSCRAFARRIEFQCLRLLFDRFGADEIQIRFAPTGKNAPLRSFLAGLTDHRPESDVKITRSAFEEKCPALYHSVSEAARVEAR